MTPENIAAVQNLIQTDPALEAQLESATTLEAAAQLLTQAAHAKGISVDMAVISEYLKAAMDTPLTDAELETVGSGGHGFPRARDGQERGKFSPPPVSFERGPGKWVAFVRPPM